MKKHYNNIEENKHQKIIGLLKELPKISTPDNFEYKLMLKIKNGNFELTDSKIRRSGFSWMFIPAAAVVSSFIIMFFIYNQNVNPESENPLMSKPQMRPTVVIGEPALTDESDDAVSDRATLTESEPIVPVEGNEFTTESDSYRVFLQPNDVVTKTPVELPFNDESSLEVDNFISGDRRGDGNSYRDRLVNAGEMDFEFNGFHRPIRINKKQFQILKARIDSLKNLSNPK